MFVGLLACSFVCLFMYILARLLVCLLAAISVCVLSFLFACLLVCFEVRIALDMEQTTRITKTLHVFVIGQYCFKFATEKYFSLRKKFRTQI